MKKFIILYNSPANAMEYMAKSTPEDRKKSMQAWMAWKDKMRDHLIEMGAMLTPGCRLSSNKKKTPNGYEGLMGYSVIQANDLEQAQSLLRNHPHLDWLEGCSIDIYPCMMPTTSP